LLVDAAFGGFGGGSKERDDGMDGGVGVDMKSGRMRFVRRAVVAKRIMAKVPWRIESWPREGGGWKALALALALALEEKERTSAWSGMCEEQIKRGCYGVQKLTDVTNIAISEWGMM
jgi:hypothetical protein